MSTEEILAISKTQQQQILDHNADITRRAEEQEAAERAQNALAVSLRHELLKVNSFLFLLSSSLFAEREAQHPYCTLHLPLHHRWM